MKKTKLLVLSALFSLFLCFTSFAGEWRENSTGWWYQNDDETNFAATWAQINNNWYYFKSDGYMNTGWIKVSNQWYYCETSGEMRTSTLQTDVFAFQFNADGSCLNFYENTIPSAQAGWASYGTTSLDTFTNAILSGNVIYYDGQYWATPDYTTSLEQENPTYFHDISTDTESTSTNRYGLANLDIPDAEDDTSTDLDGIN